MNGKVDNLWKLHAAAWESFKRRAGHEFKFALSLWAAAALLIAAILKREVHSVPTWLAIAVSVAFVVAHWWYERGNMRSNDLDLAKCYEMEAAIMTEIWAN